MVFRERKAKAIVLGVCILIGATIKVIGIPVFYAVPMRLALIALLGVGVYQLMVNKDV